MKKLTTVEDYYKLSLLEQYRRSHNIRKCYGKYAEGDFYHCYDAGLKGVTPRGKVLQRFVNLEWNKRLRGVGK
ncbi:hypothetical protein BIZ90_gp030 [Escherichia phage vB_EcoM_Alf5]|uniref:Uncharacterized protein n=1 Tax=Escherichia phage vB_EcoM_Alf5 TaxID=1873990 RepID=A0A1B1PD50_9CAUD|nr:hypothetical protein BIZ90_gp030 [Escherichia phage vB_EcoM_Alf5]ANT42092.1 hypothetical protein Alf5_030 [Escherichia phage vB_EcoM_Alf5]